jgi:tRNA pseudouridine55 synthase
VCFGRWTRLAGFLAQRPKRYVARVRFGFATDTDDATGRPLGAIREIDAVEPALLERACRALIGEIDQVVPAYSAKRVEGRRLHEQARAGRAVAAPTARVRVHGIDVLESSGAEVVLDVRCAAGTYVRAIARDLGRALDCGGHLAALRRTEAGGFTIDETQDLEALVSGAVAPSPVRGGRVLAHLPAMPVSDDEIADIRHGRALVREVGATGVTVRLFSSSGELLALADIVAAAEGSSAAVRPKVVLAAPD